MIYEFMKEHRGTHRIVDMSGQFGVSPAAYYKWAREGFASRRKEADAELLKLIREIVEKNQRRYGSPRVRAALRKEYGKRVSRKKVAKMMREHGLNARIKRSFVRTTNSNHRLPVCENILSRDFNAGHPGEKWVSDITYLRTTDGWVYLTTVIDLYDRKVAGWALSADMEAIHTTISALEMAFANRKPRDGMVFHSDRGAQYCAATFRDRLRALCPTVRQSMSRKGEWTKLRFVTDNACAETFFKTLKRELETLDGKHSATEVRQSVFMYIGTYYNRERLHSALDYFSPNDFNLNRAA